jgi:hypothetical protein
MAGVADGDLEADLQYHRSVLNRPGVDPSERIRSMNAIRALEGELTRRMKVRMVAVQNVAHRAVDGLDEYEKERGFRRD